MTQRGPWIRFEGWPLLTLARRQTTLSESLKRAEALQLVVHTLDLETDLRQRPQRYRKEDSVKAPINRSAR